MRRDCCLRDVMTFSLMNNIRYIFIVRRLGKQSKLILSRSDSISNLKLNLKIHGPCGPNAHAGADLQVFLIFCFKPILLSAYKLILLIYGDNLYQTGLHQGCFFQRRHCQISSVMSPSRVPTRLPVAVSGPVALRPN